MMLKAFYVSVLTNNNDGKMTENLSIENKYELIIGFIEIRFGIESNSIPQIWHSFSKEVYHRSVSKYIFLQSKCDMRSM